MVESRVSFGRTVANEDTGCCQTPEGHLDPIVISPPVDDVPLRQRANDQWTGNGSGGSSDVHSCLCHWSPFPGKNLAGHAVGKRYCGEAKADQRLGGDQTIDAVRAWSDRCSDERDERTANQQVLSSLEGV